jgi:diketogulonate reductase-like aldo/keto reductase
VRQKIHHQGEEASSIVAYSHVKNMYYSEQPSALLYLFKMGEKWLIGESVGEDACYTYVEDNASAPELIQSRDWHYLSRFLKDGEPPQGETELGWTVDEGRLYHKSSFTGIVDHSNAFEAVRFARTIKFIPTGQSYRTLRNGLPMPIMGLGTGGLHPDETYDTLITSLRIGYRLFDLAREYNNEAIFARVLETIKTDPTLPQRDQLFIESKVWPTELGFVPTSDAIETSLAHLNTNYIDLYMLHWPECNPNIEWMHCHDTINPEGTWRESWRALERAYAEGRVASIGVSNFDVRLLDELYEMAVVKPHVVQNFAQPGEVDKDVRAWCAAHQVLYQPYASIRNLDALPAEVSNALHRMAAGRSVSPHSVAIRFFVQSGAGVIPRSRREDHLRENMGAFDYELSAEEMRELGWHGDEL